jgi:hypothetical protein
VSGCGGWVGSGGVSGIGSDGVNAGWVVEAGIDPGRVQDESEKGQPFNFFSFFIFLIILQLCHIKR